MSKKKRNKKYRPAEAQPVIHKYVAETEEKKQTKKRFLRWGIFIGATSGLLLFLLSLVF